jgi:hypothetical protein
MRKLLLKTVNADMTAHGDFVWPRSGEVLSDKWNPDPVCGDGLHGALHGCGDGSMFNWSDDAVWIVFEAIGEVVEFDGKAKCSAGNVLYAGDRKTATDLIMAECGSVPCIGAFIVGGDRSTVSGGDWATVSGGDWATVSGGDWATVSGGVGATVSGGVGATVSGGNWATVSGGDVATVSGGDGAILSVKWHEGERYRIAVAYVGEDGIEPNVKYRCKKGTFVVAE